MKNMKNILSLSALAAAAVSFSGCVESIGVDNPSDPNGKWEHFISGTLSTTYPGKTLDEVFQATIRGVDQYGAKRVGEEHPDKKDRIYEVVARTVGDIRLTVTLEVVSDPRTKSDAVRATIQYGTYGNVKESQKVISFITRNI
ncbi:MAG: DUF3568 domain-containing protein [Puniceicoccales bacterium]|jgi:hypothetical protein|nr:DUF3568 domain-containing protein [Puniceicoccales bacterium]